MDKSEILKSLTNLFNEQQKDEDSYIITSNSIDKNNYLTLITKSNEDSFITDPDYDAFVNILKYYNTRDLKYAANKLELCKVKVLKEFSDAERTKFMSEMKDLHNRLIGANTQTLPFLEVLIKDWVNEL